jgi:hypothetical protein
VHPQGVCHDTLLWLISLSLDADPVVRAIIATDFRGELRKLVWLTENNTGVSAGICESGPDPHATYHVGDTERTVFAHPEQWQPQELPQEFRFITRESTVQEVVDSVGPYTRVTETALVCYDLPSGGALFLFPEPPFSPANRIRGIQLYRTEDAVPVFS